MTPLGRRRGRRRGGWKRRASPGLTAEVEAALAARESTSLPSQYLVDPVSLASLIVGIASLAWTVYTELRTRTAQPAPEVVARTVRARLRDSGQTAPDQVVDVVVTETIHAGADHDHAGCNNQGPVLSPEQRVGESLAPGSARLSFRLIHPRSPTSKACR